MTRAVIEAELTWIGNAFEPGHRVIVGDEGEIERVGGTEGRTERVAGGDLEPTHRLPRRALLPGFINAHSHAFQRGLRGAGERFPTSGGTGSFWTWRDTMYALAESLEPDSFRDLCLMSFAEMRDAGITAVGEFHYLHHRADTDFALDDVVLDAAAQAGIRLVLLNTFYSQGGIGRALSGAQRRFATGSLEEYWGQMDRLSGRLQPETQSLGAVAHSIRAVSVREIRALQAEAARRGLPFHMHVEEQRREIEECVGAYGRTPMALLCDELESVGNLTAVHCTHTSAPDMERFLAAGGRVCVCPITEANLGDGLPDLVLPHRTNGRLCLGSDSNARIAMLEEMRWLEYGQRLRGERRGALPNGTGSVAGTLLEAATLGGARALGIAAGGITAGAWADLVAVDLDAPCLQGLSPDRLLDGLVFGAGNEAIAGTFVGGRWRASGGRTS